MYYTVTPTISSLVARVAVLAHISNSPITTNNISLKSQQSTTFALVMGLIVAGLRPISTSPLNINYYYPITIGRVAGIFWTRSTYINRYSVITRGRVAGQNLPTSATSTVTWGRVAGLLRPMSKIFMAYTINWGRVSGINRPISATFISWRNFRTLFFRTFVVVVTKTGRRMAGLTRPRS